jgi:1-acyl-sn-glycerol-3-phosphate acyltransferase|tara:strand:+ start:2081 stop:2782 length:702 start_codon:yes stop_codon:yes gene_type:complete
MIKRTLFLFFFYFGVIFVCIFFLPALIFPQKITLYGGKILGFWSKFCLEIFLSTKVIVKGKENILNNEKFFIASAHQSQFETFFLQSLFNSPVFILKKELLRIPIFGWYLKKIGSISIDRNKITKENLGFSDQIKNHTNNSNRPIIIFPQSTRVDVLDRSSFKKGVKRIYEELNIFCQPVALNSGSVWPKNGKLKPNKTLTISILDPIKPGMNPDEFINMLQKNIYEEIDKII